MRKAHNTPVTVKAGNLARWFPPWTVTREQWHSMSRPSVSGIAIDTFLFSRIGMPLFHRYRVFDRLGAHPAFRGPYMSRLFYFLKEADAESIRRSHRRRAKEIAASMSKGASSSKEVPAATASSRWSVQRTPVSKITAREAGPSLIPTAEKDTVQELMDLSLPRFTKLDDRVIPKSKPWPVGANSPASPTSAEDGNRTRTPSPCMDLDELSSDGSVTDASPRDFKVTLLYDSEDLCTPVGSIVFSSDEDLPLSPGQEDRRKVRKRDTRPLSQPGLIDGPATEPTPMERPVETKTDSLMDKPPEAELPAGSDTEIMPLIIIENSSVVEKPKTTDGLLPIGSEILLPRSPEMASFEDRDALSAPLSPNRVKEGHSQDMPAEGSIFDVSPDLPGFNMRPAGGGLQPAEITLPPPSTNVNFNDPFFGAPIAFAQCHKTPGMDTLMTLPIYNIPKDGNIGSDQSAVPTVFASGVSPDSIPWSTAEEIIRDIVREGPFDAGATPMDTEDSLLIITGMPGCPYRITSYTGTALVDADATYGLQLHHPRFLEFIGAPESARLLNHSPSFWVNRLGQECAMAAAVNLQRDAGLMMSNRQILAQFVTSLHRMSSEMMSIGVDHVVFPVEEVEKLSIISRAQRAAKYMTVMGLWCPPSGPGALSTCPSCMKCEYCFGRREPYTQ